MEQKAISLSVCVSVCVSVCRYLFRAEFSMWFVFQHRECLQWDHSCDMHVVDVTLLIAYIKFWTHSSKSQLWHSLFASWAMYEIVQMYIFRDRKCLHEICVRHMHRTNNVNNDAKFYDQWFGLWIWSTTTYKHSFSMSFSLFSTLSYVGKTWKHLIV